MLSLVTFVGLCLASTSQAAIELHGSGTTNPSKFFWEVLSLFEARAKPGVDMSYRAVGSSTGQLEFVGATNTPAFTPWSQDFGSGDIPITASNYEALTNASVGIFHFPFQVGAMSFFHNVPAGELPAKGLELNACLLARIFKEDITEWDHPDIAALNAGLKVPAGQKITVFHRVHGSSTTAGITTYLNAACPAEWGADRVGSKIAWSTGTKEAQGSGAMSAAISSTPYSIGYIDAGHGHDDNLQEIELANKAGVYRSSLEAQAVRGVQNAAAAALTQGVLPSDPAADFSKVSLHNMDGKDVWPIVAVSYIYLRKDVRAMGQKACLLKAFLSFILSEEGQGMLPAYGFVGVPAPVLAVAKAAIEGLQMPEGADACTEWTFETDTIKGAGQKDFVISGKRRAFGEYARSNIEADLKAVIAALRLEIHNHHATAVGGGEIVAAAGKPGKEGHSGPEGRRGPAGVGGSGGVSVVALVVAILALLVSAFSLYKGTQGRKSYGQVARTESDGVAMTADI